MAEPSEPIHAGPLTSHPPDLMNDATFGTPPRRTTSSTATTEDKAGDTCRICRSEGTHDEPLFYPCKCSGSIKYVHQECLMEWLGHSHKKHCELCKTPFRFTKLYDAEMPQTLPWAAFIRRACWHAVWMSGKLGRATMVVIMWAIVLPWLVRWAWRWMFWLADAGWAREAVLGSLQEQDLGLSAGALWNGNESLVLNQISKKLGRMVELNLTLRSAHGAEAATPGPAAYQIARDVMKGLGLAASESTTSSFAAFPEVDTSILSSWTYLSTLTPFPRLNQVIIDICEGQLITCVVIVGFILVFLIREWVVQQQPLVNLDNLNNAQQQLAEAVQRVEAENVRLDRQQEILDQVRRRLTELQDESPGVDTGESVAYGTFLGWDRLESLINTATMHLRKEGEGDNSVFEFCAQAAVDQIRFAGQPPDNEITDELAEKIATKLASLTDDQRAAWELLLRRERANLPFLATDPPQIHAPSEEHLEVQESAEDDFEELPITNAGPDAKVNIKRSGKGKARAVPGPEERTPADVNKRKQEDEALKDFLGEMNLEGSAAVAPSPAGAQSGVTNPFHPDGPEPEVRQGEGVERDAASELVAHEGPESDMPTRQPSDEERQAHDAPPGMNEATADVEEGDDDEHPPRRPVIPPTYINRLVDWFWGDIQVSADHRDPPPPDEERELPFDIHEDLPPLPPAVHAVHVHHHHDPHELHGHDEPQDPADIAARQAALDADALEEAEDLEGIFELIGLQGPLLGLFQTSTFCTILVTGTVFAAVGLPYVWGKVVLNIIGSPLYFAVQLPLQIAGFVADFVLRKIAFSALVYGALVILCLGGVIWTIGKVMPGIFPICWASTEPVLEFPLDLLLYTALTPWILRVVKPSDAVNAMYAWWLRRCARVLRLSHFLFDDRRKDEEGHYVRKSWSSFLLQQNPIIEPTDPDTTAAPILTARIPPTPSPAPEVHLAADGKYVLTPCTDQYRPPKSGEAFLHVTPDGDVYVADAEGKRNEHFAKVYVPPFFRLRVTLFMVCLWVFSVFTGLCVTLVPLVFGRGIFKSVMPEGGGRVGDIYAYSVGAYALGGVLVVLLQGRKAVRVVREKTEGVDVKGLVRVTRQYALQAVKCAYVYGFLCVVLPLVFGLLIQLYFILPLHTYVVSQAAATTTTTTTTTTSATSETAATSLAANLTHAAAALTLNTLNILNTTAPSSSQPTPGTLPPPLLTIHLLQSYCLGLLYVRLASRAIVFAPTTRAHEAFHRILLDPGYLDPNAYAATRFLIAPVSLLGALAVLGPPGVVRVAVAAAAGRGGSAAAPGLVGSVPEEMQAMLYRYSYPLAAVLVVMLLCVSELGQATVRWRARIRDEVYLVGERLHNFGEKRPPVGSRSLVRKDR
ncbi:hypothetical protein LTR54_008263 [Friedmanniomyces endolithicus]|nr:hypothetical protein LTR54_008263 [Friedmanniomyces endolithicus]